MTETNMIQMTVQEALSRLKTVDARIARKANELAPLAASIDLPSGYNNEEEYLEDVRSRWQSLFALMRFRDNLRAAVTQANSQKTIKLGMNEMTVTVALNLKRGLDIRESVLEALENQINTIKSKHEVHNRRVEAAADQQVKALLGDTKPSSEEYKAMHKAYMERNSKKLIVDESLLKRLASEREQLDNFMMNIDHILTTNNVTTVIQVDGSGS